MEQAVNQFSKGLQMDTHPMVQGNDTLSDALNATFVTMNGNEVILQNDMGNRRVDNAFLPTGYEPVGIKEYGGVIYVASYNPITNRSQIGSFPSPERKIDSLDDKDLQTDFNFFSDFTTDFEYDEGIKFIKTDSILKPLSGDTSFHAGDKFSIYSDDSHDDWDRYITNYNNTQNKKIKCLKNKHLTLSVGILNSQNQFVDITKTLKRWKLDNVTGEYKEQKYSNEYSDDYIFNDGYFISGNNISKPLDYTKSDRELIKERQVIESNTYSYKLVGPMYLKVQLNHIQQFNYNMYGSKSGSTLELTVIADIVYNCPDGTSLQEISKIINGNEYIDSGTGPIKGWIPFSVFVRDKNDNYEIKQSSKTESQSWLNPNIHQHEMVSRLVGVEFISEPQYENGLYKVQARFDFEQEITDLYDENKLEYYICVDSGIPVEDGVYQNYQKYYIKNLSYKGSLDVDKLGTGEISLKEFRFFNDIENKKSTITYVLDAYPKYDQTFDNFRMEFTNIQDSEDTTYTIQGYSAYNGINTITLDWNSIGLSEQNLYEIVFYVTSHRENETEVKTIQQKRWLLTTNLFNDCYNIRSNNYVPDYREKVLVTDSNSSDYNDLSTEDKRYNNILYNKLELGLKIIKSNDLDVQELNQTTQGELIINENKDFIEYTVSNGYKVSEKINDYVDIENKRLYINDISLSNNHLEYGSRIFDLNDIDFKYNEKGEVKSFKFDPWIEENMGLEPNSGPYYSSGGDTVNSAYIKFKYDNKTSNPHKILSCTGDLSNNTVNFTLTCNSILLAQPSNQNKHIINGFAKINSEHFRNKVLANGTSHSGFFVGGYAADSGYSHDKHFIAVVIDHNTLSKPMKDHDDFKNDTNITIREARLVKDHYVTFNHSEIKELYNVMQTIDPKFTFAYIFSAINWGGNMSGDSAIYENIEYDLDGGPLAYVRDEDEERYAGIRHTPQNGETLAETIKLNVISTLGYCPITNCKVWWKSNDANGDWILLNNESGVFGGQNNVEYMFPEKLRINNSITIDNTELFSSGNQDSQEHYVRADFNNWYASNTAADMYTGSTGDGNPPNDQVSKDLYTFIYEGKTREELRNSGSNGYILDTDKNFIYCGGINKLVQNQIMNFLDPHKNIVYCIYKDVTFSEIGLYSVDQSNYLYTLPYSGNVIIRVDYNSNGFNATLNCNEEVKKILPFHIDINNIRNKISNDTHNIKFYIKTYQNFDSDINNIFTDEMRNIYIQDGSNADYKGNGLSSDTIYKEVNGTLIPLKNSPYKVYDNQGQLDYRSIICTNSYVGSSPTPTRCLRACGTIDNDKTTLEFTGVKTVDYTTFINIETNE